MASVSSLGAGTSLDLNSLYDSLQTAEETRLTPITKQQSSYKAKLTAWGIVQTALAKVQTSAAALKNTSAIANTKVTSTNTAFSATLSTTASAGSYTVEVSQLAKAQSLLSKPATSSTMDLGDSSQSSRTITITQAGQKTPMEVTLSSDQTSLSDIRDEINKKQGSVTASIIKSDDNTYYLSLTSRDTGTTNAMTVSTTDSTLASYISFDGDTSNTSNGMAQKVAAADAQLNVNGVDITRSSNTVTGAPEGVTMNLTATNVGKPETLTVAKDNSPMTTAVQAFVDAYNSLQTTIGSQTKYTAVDQGTDAQSTSNGDLLGDGTLRNIQTRLRSMISTSQSGGDYSLLSQIGITQDVNGKLTVDSTKLNKALDEKPASVINFLSGDGKTTGFATQTSNLLDQMLASDGSVQNAENGINSTLKQLSDRSEAITASITATMARYKTQFTSLSSLVSSLNNTAAYLTQQFGSSS